jgi:P-type E1-E2 ATPase
LYINLQQIGVQQKIVPGDECFVIRESKIQRIKASELVRGDIVRISKSDRICADCRLIYAKNLKIETSWITGDVDYIDYTAEATDKSTGVFEAQNLVFGGSSCRDGEALGIVIRTGNDMVSILSLIDVV